MDLRGNIVKNELHNRLKKLEAEHEIKFSNTQKVLLSIEGSITAILDVLYNKVHIFPLNQHFEKADEETAKLLEMNPGEEIHYREVLIYGKNKPMIYALSLIPLDRCRSEAREDIVKGVLPIGKILKKYKVESRHEINNVYIEKPNATLKELFQTNENFVSRDYIIIENEKIVMWTKESFPVSNFKEEMP